MIDIGNLISGIAQVMIASALYWHLKRGHRWPARYHVMQYWQDGCLWHASCTCGGTSTAPGGDGAEAMSRVEHRG